MHSLLERQLKKLFGSVDGFDPAWQAFIDSVDHAYRQSDADRGMLERALDLSSEELIQANSELRAVFQTLPDIYMLVSADGRILDFKGSEPPGHFFSMPPPIGKSLAELFPPDIHSEFASFISQVLTDKTMKSKVFAIGHQARTHDYEARCVPFPGERAIVVIRNVTERRRSEEALRKEVREKSVVLDTMSEILVYIDRDCNVVWANKAMYDAFDLSQENYEGKKCFSIHKRVARCPFCPAVKAMETGTPQIHEELSSYGKRWILRGYHVRNDQDEIVGAVEIVTDVTESRNAEDALRKSEERYKLLVEHASMAIVIIQDGMMKYANPRACESTGYRLEEMLSMPVLNLVHPDDLELVANVRGKRSRGEKTPPSYVARIIHKDGHVIWGEFAGVRLSWDGKPATMNFIKDITQERQLEEKLLQAEKLEAIGTLAGGIAHDFNNLLMGIQGYASLMLLDTPPSHPHFQKLKSIEEQVQSGANLTKQLLGFARGGKYETKATNLNKFILHNSNLFGRTRKEITIHTIFEPDLWTVAVDRGQLDQVFLNLYINAWQAMPGQGDLYIETQNIVLTEESVLTAELPPGRYVKVSVRDTGMGMDENTRRRIFDPFFTTKEMGRGVGLGLASAYGIIGNHGGMISVESEKGKGATFHILLPAVEAPPAAEDKRRGSVAPGGRGTILVVDDEKVNIDVISAMLEHLGYRAISAVGGREAVRLYRENWPAIDLVILDAIMPEIGGRETFASLKEINPQVKTIIASGHSLDEFSTALPEQGIRAFIQKPFRLEDLARKVKEGLSPSRL
ncbi:MAG: PAS domain S-box protein [Pseudomonadota bacterium]|nr:PAS domain S-box protein [Pseudomonadota bacterium]